MNTVEREKQLRRLEQQIAALNSRLAELQTRRDKLCAQRATHVTVVVEKPKLKTYKMVLISTPKKSASRSKRIRKTA
jgi:hypothetical protein